VKYIIPGVYVHYKGPSYVVVGMAHHHETRQPMVVYFPVMPHAPGEIPCWNLRPIDGPDGWLTPVTVGNQSLERFRFLHPILTSGGR